MNKNITFFFCDIEGTISGNNKEEDYIKFNELLNKIGKNNNSDEVRFVLFTDNDEQSKKSYEEKFKKYFNNYIKIINIKGKDIKDHVGYLNECKNNNEDIEDVYLAEDISMIREIFGMVIFDMGIKFNEIKTSNKDNHNTLEYINTIMEEEYLNSKKM